MDTSEQANAHQRWLPVGLGLFMAASLVGCGGGSSGDAETTSPESGNAVPAATAETVITEDDPSATSASTAVAAHHAPANFSFNNYQDYQITWNDLDAAFLVPGRNYVLRVAEPAGEVYLLAGITYDQLAGTTVSVPLAVSTLTLDVFDAMTGDLTLTQDILL